MPPELRQMRYVVEVAEQRSFSAAASRLHVAQQALSQQVKAVEAQLGFQLFIRHNRGVEIAPAGLVFVQEARRVISSAERAVARAQAVARGEAGSIRLAYTLTTVYETLPAIAAQMEIAFPKLKLELREVLGGDVADLLSDGRHDAALCPRTALPASYERQEIRREPFVAAVSSASAFAASPRIALSELREETFELWPREMTPGFYDAVVSACREAGFEPRLDEQSAGSTVWGNIAGGRGVGLVVHTLVDQLPRGITLLELAEPKPHLILDLVWHRETAPPAVQHLAGAAARVARERGWLAPQPGETAEPSRDARLATSR